MFPTAATRLADTLLVGGTMIMKRIVAATTTTTTADTTFCHLERVFLVEARLLHDGESYARAAAAMKQ